MWYTERTNKHKQGDVMNEKQQIDFLKRYYGTESIQDKDKPHSLRFELFKQKMIDRYRNEFKPKVKIFGSKPLIWMDEKNEVQHELSFKSFFVFSEEQGLELRKLDIYEKNMLFEIFEYDMKGENPDLITATAFYEDLNEIPKRVEALTDKAFERFFSLMGGSFTDPRDFIKVYKGSYELYFNACNNTAFDFLTYHGFPYVDKE